MALHGRAVLQRRSVEAAGPGGRVSVPTWSHAEATGRGFARSSPRDPHAIDCDTARAVVGTVRRWARLRASDGGQ